MRLFRFLNIVFWLELIFSVIVKARLRNCGDKLRLRLGAVVKGHANIVIGDNFNSVGVLYLFADENGYLQIGNNCSVNTNAFIGANEGKIIIGNEVMIGPNAVIRAADHGMRKDRLMREQPHTYGEIIIEEDVWIGANAVITSGVTLARGTVVGAGAVVTGSTEPYTIVGGVPARKIGERV